MVMAKMLAAYSRKPNIRQLVGGTVTKASYTTTEKGDAVLIIMEDDTQLLICTNDAVHTELMVAVNGAAVNAVRRATKRRTKR